MLSVKTGSSFFSESIKVAISYEYDSLPWDVPQNEDFMLIPDRNSIKLTAIELFCADELVNIMELLTPKQLDAVKREIIHDFESEDEHLANSH